MAERRKPRITAAQANAHHIAAHGTIGDTVYSSDMSAQGWIEFRFYTHGAADLTHALGCPGCDPNAEDRPELRRWFAIEEKWQAKGDPPRCPVRNAEWCQTKKTGDWFLEGPGNDVLEVSP